MKYHHFLVGNTSSKGPFFIAMLVYGSVNDTRNDNVVKIFHKDAHPGKPPPDFNRFGALKLLVKTFGQLPGGNVLV